MDCTCEKSVNLDVVVLDELFKVKKDEVLDVGLRAALALGYGSLLRPVDPDSICARPNPPRWCRYAAYNDFVHPIDMVSTLGRRILLESVSQQFEISATARVHRLAEADIDAATLALALADIMVGSSEKARSELVSIASSVSAVASGSWIPAPGSALEKRCRENPTMPPCPWLLDTTQARLSAEMTLYIEMFDRSLLSYASARAAINAQIEQLLGNQEASGGRPGPIDLSRVAGVIVTVGYIPDRAARLDITQSLASATISLQDDIPDECKGPNPPRDPCWYIRGLPRAHTLLKKLVFHKVLTAKSVEHLFRNVSSLSIGTWPTPD